MHIKRVGAVMALVATLVGCAGTVDSVSIRQTPGAPANEVIWKEPFTIDITGTNFCNVIVEWGDGQTTRFSSSEVRYPVALTHTYSGWPGEKTIAVRADTLGAPMCSGSFVRRVSAVQLATFSPTVRTAMAPGNKACNIMQGFPPLRSGTEVTISEVTDSSGAPVVKMDFNCGIVTCVYSMAGQPGSIAGDTFPSPGLPKFSFYARVGRQEAWIGRSGSFVVRQQVETPAPLEACSNDESSGNNGGGWLMDITVKEPPNTP